MQAPPNRRQAKLNPAPDPLHHAFVNPRQHNMSDSSENPAKDTRRSSQTDSPVFVPSPRIISASEHSDDDGDNRAQEEDGYELKELGRKTADNAEDDSEDDRLLSEKSDDGRTSGEVLYAADSGDEGSSIRSRRKPMKRPEFLYTREEERTVVRKLDKYLVGGLAVLYMLRYELQKIHEESKEKLTRIGWTAF